MEAVTKGRNDDIKIDGGGRSIFRTSTSAGIETAAALNVT
jgi:hypothetical protein